MSNCYNGYMVNNKNNSQGGCVEAEESEEFYATPLHQVEGFNQTCRDEVTMCRQAVITISDPPFHYSIMQKIYLVRLEKNPKSLNLHYLG